MNLQTSKELSEVLNYSTEEAMRTGSLTTTPDHIILGIIRHQNNDAYETLLKLNLDIENFKKQIESLIKNPESISFEQYNHIKFSTASTNILSLIYLEARYFKMSVPTPIHLLLAILRQNEGNCIKILNSYSVDYDFLKAYLSGKSPNKIESAKEFEENEVGDLSDEELDFSKKQNRYKSKEHSKTPVLDNFGFDLTKAASEGKLDPVVGRDREIERLAQILGRRKKNNPVIIGEPGVGKSAIVEGLAIRIATKKVAKALTFKRIISLDLGSVVAGTKYRGQFEERMKAILKEINKNPDIIVFIDELHTLVGAGGASGSLDAANMLKPALARGELQCIGATTLDEYREHIEKDGALERRFQKVMVEPTDFEATLDILQNIRVPYEKHHNVKYTDEALTACIRLSQRYITDRCLPDKAIDAMDEAGSRVHLKNLNLPPELIEIKSKLDKLKENKVDAVNIKNFDLASEIQQQELILNEQQEAALKKWSDEKSLNPDRVDENDVAEVLSMITSVPIFKLAESEGDKLMKMDGTIKTKIIGQDDAVEKIVRSIRRNRAGLKDPNKPIGTFLFLGPTGVGKTQLAKILTEYLFDSVDNLIRIDMSEYMEKFSISRLIGAPPGYVGYEEGGQLSEKVRRKPYSVILLDEIEKAHPDLFNILLQVFDEGRLTDSNGRHIDFRNTLLIMTSNIGSREVKDFGAGLGFSNSTKRNISESTRNIIEKALQKSFSPEFLNRIDEQILFNSLSREDICKIIDIELDDLYKRVRSAGFKIELTDDAKNFVAEQGYDPKFGARPLKRAIQKYIEDPLAEAIIVGNIKEGSTLKLEIEKNSDKSESTEQKLKVSVV